ncbi:tyrosine-type recombinase/integrase [Mesorhizobium sp. IMUNJ 23232]|uniref:tyrosine-type recombinase/integrase n=1 Tax=Mesorhizobium sp. IMUNJ 23232 TaxID=3376064 RepID=UPI0037A09D80
MASALTVKAVENLKAGAARQEIPDGALPGLYLVIQSSGSKSWALRYRFEGKPKKLTIGPVLFKRDGEDVDGVLPLGQSMTLVEARRAARESLQAIGEGRDPGAAKKEIKAVAIMTAAVVADDKDTVEKRGALFIERVCKPKNKTWQEAERHFKTDINPAFGSKNVRDVTKADVLDLIDAIVDRGSPVSANRVLATLKTFFGWLEGRDVISTNPTAKVAKPTEETSRDRKLTDDEVRLFWEATAGLGYPFTPMFRLMLLTGQRRQEVAGMLFGELSGDQWLIPAERTKNGNEHLVPLPPMATAIIEKLPRIGKAGYAFTTTGKTPASGFSRAKERLDTAMLAILKKQAVEAGQDPDEVSVTAWRLHDLRRTAASGMASLRIDTAVIEKSLNHISGTFAGVAGVYNRFAYLPEKTAALAAWADHVAVMVGEKQADNIVPMVRHATKS